MTGDKSHVVVAQYVTQSDFHNVSGITTERAGQQRRRVLIHSALQSSWTGVSSIPEPRQQFRAGRNKLRTGRSIGPILLLAHEAERVELGWIVIRAWVPCPGRHVDARAFAEFEAVGKRHIIRRQSLHAD